MQASGRLDFFSAGVVCSVGLSTPTASAAIYGSINRFRESHFVDRSGESIIGAAMPDVLTILDGDENPSIPDEDVRCARMFARAATECLQGSGVVDTRNVAMLFLGRDRPNMSGGRNDCHRRMHACLAALGRSFHADSRLIMGGRAGIAAALGVATGLLTRRAVASVMIAGVDSLLNTWDISSALASDRLKTDACSDGFIPGEAAACVMMSLADTRRPSIISIEGFGKADEPHSWSSGKHCTGIGLASAIRQALQQAGLEASEIGNRFSDCSGESYFFDESAYAWGRVLRAPGPSNYRQILIAASLGDIGSAAAPLALAFCREAAVRGWTRHHYAMLHFSGLGNERAAIVVKNRIPHSDS